MRRKKDTRKKNTGLEPLVKQSRKCRFTVAGIKQIDYKDVNVLEDPNIRIKLSEHSNWPTIPQLFVKGELIGGCDIVVELHNSNELEKILL